MAQIGCDFDKPRIINLSTLDFIVPASRVYPLEQRYGIDRQLQHPTRSTLIAMEKHRRMNIINGRFANMADLNVHQELMLLGMLNGLSFNEAHSISLRDGPRPIR